MKERLAVILGVVLLLAGFFASQIQDSLTGEALSIRPYKSTAQKQYGNDGKFSVTKNPTSCQWYIIDNYGNYYRRGKINEKIVIKSAGYVCTSGEACYNKKDTCQSMEFVYGGVEYSKCDCMGATPKFKY